jgi:DNA-binding GntR family transcriptional regulator
MTRYVDISKDLRSRIDRGEFTDRLPTVKVLVSEYRTSISTIMQVAEKLKAERIIYSKPGKGYFLKRDLSGIFQEEV